MLNSEATKTHCQCDENIERVAVGGGSNTEFIQEKDITWQPIGVDLLLHLLWLWKLGLDGWMAAHSIDS